MTGEEAQYIERRGANTASDDREIRMEGRRARYEEHSMSQAAHFPMNGNEALGRQWFEFLTMRGFIAADTEIGCWQYVMGFSAEQPTDIRPIEWLKTKETARLMIHKVNKRQLASKQMTVVRLNELTAQCFTKNGEPLKLAKAKEETSLDAEAIENFFPTISDL